MIMGNLEYSISEQFRKVNNHKENFFKKQLEEAVPKIKGEITPGKLRWRGIRMIHQNVSFGHTVCWLEQRGKRIGGTLTITNGIPKYYSAKDRT